ncbi:MAG TPA: AAA family ATPase [Kineosporiaceae bacterium]|nr:AAA family ATPase [Kineosporiaceae bacterium]
MAERAAIDRLLRGALDRRSGSLVLTGDPGIGKSTLLGYAADRAREQGLMVLTVRGYESESEIPFAGLADLLTPVLSRLQSLPEPQIRALESALSLGPPAAGDRFSVCAATIGMLAATAEESPLLVVVDDGHWLDTSSREAILFAARRLNAEGIALLLACRAVSSTDSEYAGVRQLRLEALDRAEADQLFDQLAPAAPAHLRREIYDDAAGNPLGIRELCDQLARGPAPFRLTGMPSDSRLTRALGGRLANLPEPTRRALLLVAASGGAETDVVLLAAQRSGLGLADYAPAEEAGLLLIGERRIEFRHPLLRSVLYGSASTHARASAHAALAEVLEVQRGDAAADARAWHLAAARFPPDEETARLLEATGLRARGRSGYIEAAHALEQAARFAAPEQRPARLLRAARAWQLAGRPRQVLVLLEEALPLATDARLRAVIRHMDAYIRMWREEPAAQLAGMAGAAADVQEVDPGRAAIMYADAGIACFMLGRIADAMRLITRAQSLGRRGNDVVQLVTTVAMAAGSALLGRRAEASALLATTQDALLAADPLSRAQEYAHAAYTLMWLEDYRQAADRIDRVVDRARAAGAIGVLPQVLALQSELSFRLGRWSEAVAVATESLTLAEQSRQGTVYARYFLARMDGVQGRTEECLRRMEEITATARRLNVGCMELYIGHVLGLVALGAGNLDEAIRQLELVRGLRMVTEMRDQSLVPWAYDLVEAYARSGRTAEAHALLESVAPAPDDATHRWQHAVAARCRGLLAPRETMMVDFQTALTWHDRAQVPFERARTLLCLGERLRRERRRSSARGYLRRALETFEQLGAEAWAARARVELAATGETLTRGAGVAWQLTPQELQVGLVVGRGATNQEAASALFLSPKTIEYHLSNIYRKTQLHSRADLAVLATAAS